ncbi:hypothetical protein CEXT_775471 [Caerostris extrusa]|uniref:Estradiol 17-beta-dehydrogenase 2 n=1 Tax=Caerostris extrusa TaxID=172846 RepID=A0AAV4N0F4_CAEEX|nr:hypothetical protein CEXT_775471 [Caerostris extrusa]
MNLLLFLLFLFFTFEFTKKRCLNDKVEAFNKAVFITGCDSGFGHLLAKRLDSKRISVELDVTQDDSVTKAFECVKDHLRSSGAKLWAVVNNAGVQRGFSLEISETKDFKDCMEVNAFGPMRVTKAFLPLLKETKGRIVNVTSLSARIAVREVMPYSMSKFAAGAFNDCLRQEMSSWGISVVSIEPELFKTPLTNVENLIINLNHIVSNLPNSVLWDYGKEYFKAFEKFMIAFTRCASPNVELVVNDLEAAVIQKYPDNHYKPRRNLFFRFILFCFEIFPSNIQDIFLNIVLFFLGLPKPKPTKAIG